MKTKTKYQINEKLSYEKERDRLLQKQNETCLNYKELHGSHVEQQNKLKSLQEKVKNE